MNKYSISSTLRKLSLIKFADRLRFYFVYVATSKSRHIFLKNNPTIKLPPAYYIYETFNLNYYSFYNKSIETAEWLVSFFQKHTTNKGLTVLDWGCGPGRVIRHLPNFMDESCQFYGTDYNKSYIKWCKQNIQKVSFSSNQLTPPLNYNENTFDIIYGISIFTHLSEKMHFAWINELIRVLKPSGIIFLTLQGNIYRNKLTKEEKRNFDNGKLIVKSNTKEGHRTYSAFQPAIFVEKLIRGSEILEHIEGEIVNGKPQQDIWIIRVND